MKIGIISDTHGSLGGWEKGWEILKDSDIIIHCGDLFNHGPGNPVPEKYSPKELLNIFNSLKIPLLISKGNCDSEVDQTFLNIPMASPFLFYQINNLRFIVSHGHIFRKEEWTELGKKWKVNFLISGHTHIPSLEKIENIIILNPGSPSIPKEKIPTSAMIDLSEKSVKIYNLFDQSIIKKENL
ncbi:MAG TPA: phosphodiesterase [bacterium]|mgnify:CR=1 FL=1|nr:phosphodiesterase [bacterium]HOM27475.1 phosphodiesterase [bacterium]